MDRHPQQIKRERQDKKKRLINISKNSDMRTVVKNVLNNKNKDEAALLHNKAMSTIDKMVSKGHLKKNTAARRKSKISKHLNSLS